MPGENRMIPIVQLTGLSTNEVWNDNSPQERETADKTRQQNTQADNNLSQVDNGEDGCNEGGAGRLRPHYFSDVTNRSMD